MAIRVPPDSRLPRELGAYRHGVAVRRALAAHRARVARERRRLIRERSGARSKMGDTALDVLGRVRVALLEPVHAVVIGTRLVGHGAQALRFLFRRASASVTAPEEFLVTGHRGSP